MTDLNRLRTIKEITARLKNYTSKSRKGSEYTHIDIDLLIDDLVAALKYEGTYNKQDLLEILNWKWDLTEIHRDSQ